MKSKAKKYFHEITQAEADSLVASASTWEQVRAEYKQPDWCQMPDAINGSFGCWALVDLRKERIIISEDFCSCCEYCKA